MTYLIVTIIIIISSILYLKLADRFNIVDKPNQRSSHTVPTIRGGGVLFFIAILLFFVLSKYQYPYFFIGTFIIAAVSFIDDLKTLSSKLRLPFQFLAVYLVLFQIFGTDINFWLIPILCIAGVGYINLYNFMDGINGITGIYSFVVVLFMYLINKKTEVLNSDLLIYQAIAITVFGFYNFRKKARFFAGDIGSISLAMLVFFIGTFMIYKLESPLILMLGIVYGTDGVLTVLYRMFIIKENVSEAHRHHIYQKLVDRTILNHLQVSLLYAFVQVIVSSIVLIFYRSNIIVQIAVLSIIILSFVLLYIISYRVLEKKK